jgi:hypothetical protein
MPSVSDLYGKRNITTVMFEIYMKLRSLFGMTKKEGG